jgi:large subunit ribosomal protein L3
MAAIIGTKVGMTQVFTEDGSAVPVTVVEAAPNTITAIRKGDRDGYDAVQLAGVPVDERKLTKPELGHLKKAGAAPARAVTEFRDVDLSAVGPSKDAEPPAGGGEETGSDDADAAEDASSDPGDGGPKVGDQVTVSSFQPGEKVKVSAISIGKGFQGTMKRHNFSRGPVTHGSHNVRAPGSAGASADPSRIFPGQKMPGQMGRRRVTQLGATVHEVDAENNLLLIKGSVPGGRNATVEVRSDG